LYQQFFNFNTAPFSIAPDPHFIYMSEHHQEGLAHLLYGINHGGGFIALTGEVGTGKTTLCHCLLQQLPENVEIALVLNPKVNAIELLATICDELHISYQQEKQTLKGLVDNLNDYLLAAHACGKRTVLVIDEAQNLSLGVLEQIRLLTNLETSTTKLLQIILLGQPELKQLLEKPALRQLNQRITARYHLTALSYPDTQSYIKHRLKVSGGNAHTFNRRAIKKIYLLSKGIPRLINVLCDRALLGAYVDGTQSINVKIINKAAKEVFSPEEASTRASFIISFFVVLIVSSIYYFWPKAETTYSKHVILSDSFVKPNKAVNKPQVIVEKEALIIEPDKLSFREFLESQPSSLAALIPQLATLWGKGILQGEGCTNIEATGLSCLFDKAEWAELKALNRPVIMEFELSELKKVYALLVRVDKGLAIFLIDEEISVPLEQVLKYWNGYYLIVWQPLIPEMTMVYPYKETDSALWIRRQLGNILADGNANLFDQTLKQAVITFQKEKGLLPDGIVGPKTFIQLNNNDPLNVSPKLNRDD